MIKFITLFSSDIHRVAQIYECLGLRFVEEKHGSGPVHLASNQDGQVLEIYPGFCVKSRSVLLGFEVPNLGHAKAALEKAGAEIVQDIAMIAECRRLIARDPDGRELFVLEADTH